MKDRTARVCWVLSAELEQQLEKSCVVLSPSPLSALLLIGKRQTLPPRGSPSDDDEEETLRDEYKSCLLPWHVDSTRLLERGIAHKLFIVLSSH